MNTTLIDMIDEYLVAFEDFHGYEECCELFELWDERLEKADHAKVSEYLNVLLV